MIFYCISVLYSVVVKTELEIRQECNKFADIFFVYSFCKVSFYFLKLNFKLKSYGKYKKRREVLPLFQYCSY